MNYTNLRSLFFLSAFIIFTISVNAQNPSAAVRATAAAATAAAPPNFLFLADIHLNHDAKDTPRKDDTGTDLWTATKKRLHSAMGGPSAPKFIIYTGDLTAHNYQPHSHVSLPQEKLDTNMAIVLRDLHAIAGDVPLFYAPGNNDALEGDYANFANYAGKTPFSLIDNANIQYPAPNATMVSQPHPERGYYSARPFDGLRVIALNSVIWGKEHWTNRFSKNYVAYGDTMMTWLTDELLDVKAKGEKAFLIMHIPPGIDAFSKHMDKGMWDKHNTPSWQDQFLQLADLHKDDITGIFYGHTHMDEIRLIAKPGAGPGTPVKDIVINEVAISGPGISPNHGQHPAFKTVSYDAKTFEPIDFTTYYTSQYNPTWSSSDKYTFSEKYRKMRISDLTGALTSDKFEVIHKGLLETYKAGNGTASGKAADGLLVY